MKMLSQNKKFGIFTKVVAILVALICISSTEQLVKAQGKLGRISQAVRKNDPKPEPPKPEPPRRPIPPSKPDRDDHDRRDDNRNDRGRGNDSHRHHQHNQSRNRNRGSRASGTIFIHSSPVCDPVVIPVVEQVPVPYPVIPQPVNQAVLPGPVVEPIIIDQPTPYVAPSVEVVQQTPVLAAPETVYTPVVQPVIEEVVVQPVQVDWFQRCSSKIWATLGTDFDGIVGGELGLHLQECGGLGLEGSVMTLRESGASFRDHLWIGDFNVVYEALATDYVRGRMGVGVNWLSDAWGGEAGFNLHAGVDIRLADRLTLATEGNIGNLGDADFLRGQVTLGRRFEASELLIGAEHIDIGGVVINRVFTGLQMRF